MLIDFFFTLREAGIPASIKEFLALLEALQKNVIARTLDDFYHLARLTLVKDEAHFDRYDRAFAAYFKGVDALFEKGEVPLDWLLRRAVRELTPEQKRQVEKFGYDQLMDRLKQLLEEQKERHEGGGKWIGTGGTSPFGNSGYHPEGVRIGGQSEHRSAVKVWEQRSFRDYDASREIGTRNIKVALRRLRRFARDGAAEELALDETIRSTAGNAGWLDIRMRPERRNNVKVLMLLDVGGTMDEHARRTEELFSAARGEFKHMDFFYFHNCVYGQLWRSNQRRHAERFDTRDVLRKYPPDTKLIFVGDATMSPYEILQAGGAIDHHNEEAGATWLQRFTKTFPRHIWLNPEPEHLWEYRQSIALIRRQMDNRMFPLTLDGLARGMRMLSK